MTWLGGLDGAAALVEAAAAVGLVAEVALAARDGGVDVVLVTPAGDRVPVVIKRVSLVSADGLRERIDGWRRSPSAGDALGVVVADRITGEARELLAAAGWGWLDLRGHVRIVGNGLFVDADVAALRDAARVAPVPMVCSRRVDATAWANQEWPLAHPLFVALDLAQDPNRGTEILQAWTPPEPCLVLIAPACRSARDVDVRAGPRDTRHRARARRRR